MTNFIVLRVTDDFTGQVKGKMSYCSRMFYGMRYNIELKAFYGKPLIEHQLLTTYVAKRGRSYQVRSQRSGQ